MAFGGDLVVRLGMDSSKFNRGMSKTSKKISSFARSATGALAGIGLALGAKSSVQAFETQRVAIAKLEAVLKATGGTAQRTSKQIQDFASARQGVTNFGDEVTIAGASVLATFKNIQGEAFDKTIIAAQNVSTVMGQDLQSSMVQLGKAVNDPIAGLSALSRVGITFNDEQKEQIKLLQQSGDLMGAQGIILGELESQFGGAAEAARSPFTALSNTFGDLQEKVGELIAGGDSGSLVGWLEGVIKQVMKGVDIMIEWKDSFTEWSSAGISASTGFFGTIVRGVKMVIDWFKLMFFAMVNIELTFSVIKEAANNSFNSIAGRVEWLKDVFMDFMTWFSENWAEVFRTSMESAMTITKNFGKNFVNLHKGVFQSVKDGFANGLQHEPMVALFEGVVNPLKDFKVREFIAPEAVADAKNKFKDAYGEWKDMGQSGIPDSIVPAATPSRGGPTPPKPDSAKQEKTRLTDAVSLNSKEGFKTILMAMTGGSKEDKVEKNTGTMVKTLASIDRKMDAGNNLKVVGVPT